MKTIDERFQVKRARLGMGLGLFARVDIKKKDFILEYTGERVPTPLADDMTSRYLFEIDEKWTIKGPPSINLAGYINHSCDPNVEAEIERGKDGEDHINIYATRGIRKGQELFIDYGDEYFDEFLRPVGCKCGSPKCRSKKPPKKKKTAKK
jgi:SET domain-containing protein